MSRDRMWCTVVSATGLILIGLLAGCGSSNSSSAPPAAAAVPPPREPMTVNQIKSELIRGKTQIEATTAAMNNLVKAQPADVQAKYNAFEGEFIKLENQRANAKMLAEDLKTRSQQYYDLWSKQVEVENPELRRRAAEERTQAVNTFNRVKSEMELVKLSFDPYMSKLKDIGSYLRSNMTPAALGSVSTLADDANRDSKSVMSHIDSLIADLDRISQATGAGAAPAGTKPPPS